MNKEQELKSNPMGLLLSLSIDSALVTHSAIIDLVNKYKANSIDAIPISEIENCIKKGIEKATGKDGLMASILND